MYKKVACPLFPNLTWEQTVQKYSTTNTDDELWKSIIESSQRSNKVINEQLGVKPIN